MSERIKPVGPTYEDDVPSHGMQAQAPYVTLSFISGLESRFQMRIRRVLREVAKADRFAQAPSDLARWKYCTCCYASRTSTLLKSITGSWEWIGFMCDCARGTAIAELDMLRPISKTGGDGLSMQLLGCDRTCKKLYE